MGRPAIKSEKLGDGFILSLCHPDYERRKENYFLWDNDLRYNIVMGALTKEEALEEALLKYQERYRELKKEFTTMQQSVNRFISENTIPLDEEDYNDNV